MEVIGEEPFALLMQYACAGAGLNISGIGLVAAT